MEELSQVSFYFSLFKCLSLRIQLEKSRNEMFHDSTIIEFWPPMVEYLICAYLYSLHLLRTDALLEKWNRA